MKGMTAFACMSDIDLDIIEESMGLFAPARDTVIRGRQTASPLARFFGSGWGVAVICAVVSLSVLAAIVWAGQGGPVTPPPGTVETDTADSVTEPLTSPGEGSDTAPAEPTDTGADTGADTESDTAGEVESETETAPETEGVFHPDATEGGVLFISLGDGTCKIKGADKNYEGKITVPEKSPYGDTVTTVAAGAFKGFKSVTEVVLPETVTVIKGSAFQGCSELRRVTLPSEVTEFGRAMFELCGELESVVLPLGVTEIPAMTFQTCVSLQSVVAKDRITAIGANAFNGCRSMGTLTLSKGGLESIGEQAFMNCCGLHTVYYGGSRAEWDQVEVEPLYNSYIYRVNVICNG